MGDKQCDEQVKNITQINVDLTPRKITMMNENMPRKNDVHKNKNISQTNLVLQNTRGLLTENSNKKLKMIEEYANDEKIVAMNFTETWYEKTIEENANIDGYNIFRCDRKEIRGGVAIYLHEKVEAEIICEIRHKGCEMVTINIVVYRTQETKKMVFD